MLETSYFSCALNQQYTFIKELFDSIEKAVSLGATAALFCATNLPKPTLLYLAALACMQHDDTHWEKHTANIDSFDEIIFAFLTNTTQAEIEQQFMIFSQQLLRTKTAFDLDLVVNYRQTILEKSANLDEHTATIEKRLIAHNCYLRAKQKMNKPEPDYFDAEGYYRLSLSLNPEWTKTMYGLAVCLTEQVQFTANLNILEEILAILQTVVL